MGTFTSNVKITIIGSGTSTGVPVIGCSCDICSSSDKRNKRSRSSILISINGKNILIDTSTDLRCQALKNNIKAVNAVLFTHPHADHVHGIDELRSFNFIQKETIPCYGDERTLERIRCMFSYIFDAGENTVGIPRLEMNRIDGAFNIFGLSIVPLVVMHGDLPILGYRFANAAYITDCSRIPEETMAELEGLDFLVLGALRYTPHSKHFNIDEALAVVEEIRPKKAIFTHLSHEVDFKRTSLELPENVSLAYDGLTIEINHD